ncbi:MAG: hypothetical protein AB9866_18955 [Syntrophobacteraceae bacterium]
MPQGYEPPKTSGNYYKFQSGVNHFRILSSAITGWLDWDEKTPVRTKEQPEHSIDPSKPAKHFWAFVVWDYMEADVSRKIKIMELTQATIRDAILSLHQDVNWGSPTGYDLKITKQGEKMETKYSVVPVPPKPLHAEIARMYAETDINLNELYRNGDPFNPSPDPANPENVRIPTAEEVDMQSGVQTDEIQLSDIPF